MEEAMPKKMDPEIKGLKAVIRALAPLTTTEQKRALEYLWDRLVVRRAAPRDRAGKLVG